MTSSRLPEFDADAALAMAIGGSAFPTITEARERIEQQLAVIAAAERILPMLPEDIAEKAVISCSNEWIQLSNLDREQVERAMRALRAGKWSRSESHNGGLIDYETQIHGVRVLIYSAPPPVSCRIIEESVTIPEHTFTKRRVICAEKEAS